MIVKNFINFFRNGYFGLYRYIVGESCNAERQHIIRRFILTVTNAHKRLADNILFVQGQGKHLDEAMVTELQVRRIMNGEGAIKDIDRLRRLKNDAHIIFKIGRLFLGDDNDHVQAFAKVMRRSPEPVLEPEVGLELAMISKDITVAALKEMRNYKYRLDRGIELPDRAKTTLTE